jgi:hypothetical protein
LLLVLLATALLVFPVALGEVRRRVPPWWSPSQHNLVLMSTPSGWPCVAAEGGSLCLPLWASPWFVVGWYRDQVRRLLQ